MSDINKLSNSRYSRMPEDRFSKAKTAWSLIGAQSVIRTLICYLICLSIQRGLSHIWQAICHLVRSCVKVPIQLCCSLYSKKGGSESIVDLSYCKVMRCVDEPHKIACT